MPVPDELRDDFVAAYWRSNAWKHTTWLGHTVQNTPVDLVTYQEIVAEVRPDFIIETGTGNAGRAHFLASICDLLDHGHVISIDKRESDGFPPHPRITYLTGRAHEDEVLDQVRALVAPTSTAVVILGTRGAAERMRKEFEAYAPFVPVDSYVIMEHTVLNGYPALPSFGPGPREAVRRILRLDGDFVADTEREKHSLTFDPSGFLRRIR
jgi:cephalosporin hydroxylase